MDTAPSSPVTGPNDLPVPADPQNDGDTTVAPDTPGPSAAPKRVPKPRLTKNKTEGTIAYTNTFVPGLYNVKNPVGDYGAKESNLEVFRHMSQARARKEKEEADKAREEALEMETDEGDKTGEEKAEDNFLSKVLVIHPGSRFLRLGRASDFYPKEVPNCIARPSKVVNGQEPPVLGKRNREEDVNENIGHLRDYLRNRLRANKLTTDWKEGQRVNAYNARSKPESIPEHNDPYRVDWTEVDGRDFVIGTEALRLSPSAGFTLRYPIIQRHLNTRDWCSPQLLLGDLTLILQESLRNELDIKPRDYKDYSVVLIVPDHGDRVYVEELTNVILHEMGFKEIAIHQESYCAIFSAGMSSACVVDIGAEETSITCVDEGLVNPDTRMVLSYGGDDVTVALTDLLQRSSFPYKDLDLARAQDWLMMDQLKIRVCTLEEHLVANTPWEFYVPTNKLTQKYLLRTYDENVLAPLCWFDTRMIDFETKKESTARSLFNPSGDVSDLIKSSYGEPTAAMKQVTQHLFPQAGDSGDVKDGTPVPAGVATPSSESSLLPGANGATPLPPSASPGRHAPSAASFTPAASLAPPTAPASMNATPVPEGTEQNGADEASSFDIAFEASRRPLDGAIAASICQSASENKVKTAASSVLLVGGGSALKGLAPFIAERLPPLLRQRGFPIDHVQIVPPPRNLNPKFVSWKGASVMCNIELLNDMWIRRDEYEAIGARALKERLPFF